MWVSANPGQHYRVTLEGQQPFEVQTRFADVLLWERKHGRTLGEVRGSLDAMAWIVFAACKRTGSIERGMRYEEFEVALEELELHQDLDDIDSDADDDELGMPDPTAADQPV